MPIYALLILAGVVLVIVFFRMKSIKKRFLAEMWAREELERKRIAKDLHDETGQMLTALTLNLEDLKRFAADNPQLLERIDRLGGITSEAIEEVERLINNLRPGPLEDLSLLSAIKWYIKEYVEPTGIQVSWVIDGYQERLPEDIETAIYRIVQEAVTNVLRHAAASSMEITLAQTEKKVIVAVADNGRGLETANNTTKGQLGLKGIKERVELLGGNFSIHSQQGKGTTIQVSIPVSKSKRR